jgi:hypothetical protein
MYRSRDLIMKLVDRISELIKCYFARVAGKHTDVTWHWFTCRVMSSYPAWIMPEAEELQVLQQFDSIPHKPHTCTNVFGRGLPMLSTSVTNDQINCSVVTENPYCQKRSLGLASEKRRLLRKALDAVYVKGFSEHFSCSKRLMEYCVQCKVI